MLKSKNLIIASWNRKDYILFFLIIPSLLILIFFLAQNIKSSFILKPKNPSLLSIFLSNFTHTEVSHLQSNLSLYFLVTFLIFNIETKKNIFQKSMLLVFTVLPILSSLIGVYFLPMLNNIQGFSTIVSGLLGYFLYSACNYIKVIYKVERASLVWLILMLNFTILTAYQRWFHLFIPTAVISLALLYANRTNIKDILRKIKLRYKEIRKLKFLGRVYRIDLFLLSLLFMFTLPFVIPFNIRMGTTVINTPAHYFGYCFGLIIALAIEKLTSYRYK